MRIHSVTTCKVFIRGSYCIFRVFFRDQSKSHTYYRSIIWGVCQAASLLLWLRRVKIPILAKGRCCYLNNREIIYNEYGGVRICTERVELSVHRYTPSRLATHSNSSTPYLSVHIRTHPYYTSRSKRSLAVRQPNARGCGGRQGPRRLNP